MGRACSANGENRSAYMLLVRTSQEDIIRRTKL
jgi:hypothetical protein